MRKLLFIIAATVVFGQSAHAAGSSSTSNSTAGTNSVSASAGYAVINQTSNSSGSVTIRNTPNLSPPAIYGGTNVCAIGGSGGLSLAGIGIAGGGMWDSKGCERRNIAVILFQAHMPDVATALLCQDPNIDTAFAQAGQPCPANPAQPVSPAVAVVAPAPAQPESPPVAAGVPAPASSSQMTAPSYAGAPAPAAVVAPVSPPAGSNAASEPATPVMYQPAGTATPTSMSSKQSWCNSATPPAAGDMSPDAASYRYYCK